MQRKPCEKAGLYKRVRHPAISIIAPFYNGEKRISIFKSLLKSAAEYPNFCEITVVDNGSSNFIYEIAWQPSKNGEGDGQTLRGH